MAMQFSRVTARQRLVAMAAACVAAVAAALVAQHGFDMQPCPWCILQRVIYLALAAVCVLAAALPSRALRVALSGLALVLALLGAASAIYQHVVAAKLASCNLTLADKIITALGIESLLPELFQVTATCADAAVSVLGVPFEYWSLALFVLLALVAVSVLARLRHTG
jgi:protein dithiol:quinone oxidoreductase